MENAKNTETNTPEVPAKGKREETHPRDMEGEQGALQRQHDREREPGNDDDRDALVNDDDA